MTAPPLPADPARQGTVRPTVPFEREPLAPEVWTQDHDHVLATSWALLCTGVDYRIESQRERGPMAETTRSPAWYRMHYRPSLDLCGTVRRLTTANRDYIAAWCRGQVLRALGDEVAVPTRGGRHQVATLGDLVVQNGNGWHVLQQNRTTP